MKDVTSQPEILKVGSCPTVSSKSTLTYHVGKSPDGAIHLCITANTAAGFFSQEWVSMKDIEEALAKGGHHFTSQVLRPLFAGKSMNNPAFLLAVLLDLGVVIRSPTQKRCYEKGDMSRFNTLIDGDKPGPKAKSPSGRKAKAKESDPGS